VCAERASSRVIAGDGAGDVIAVDFTRSSVGDVVTIARLTSIRDACAGRVAVTSLHEDARSAVHDLANGRAIMRFDTHRPLALTSDGTRVLRHHGPVLDVLDATTGAIRMTTRRGHDATVRHVVWARDGSLVAT